MQLTFYDNYFDGLDGLSDAEIDAFMGKVARYVFRGEEPTFDGTALTVWKVIEPLITKSIQGQKNGAQGGNGRGNKTPKKNPQEKPSNQVEGEGQKPPQKTPALKEKERKEGFLISNELKTPSSDIKEIFDEADRIVDAKLADAKREHDEFGAHYASMHEASVPCPDNLNPFGGKS